ncbi:antibiotic biosynthesis monooxygenase [Palleronia sediminis]|uniref:Antibiotic biosynthesis monooxygenase n=1 Tax=Palleronia sediminis TaxID=2547833 RepID=A0A4R6AQV8_9RHOB|nr:antibiotic biosynthesis monooxygenase [Palleronia sediminis]TDL84103.1 antibiotic biosynthesis monooxygenase [Palleronia sediminis]
MYLTMNRFQVTAGREAEFEDIWARRESHLDAVPGFKAFHLMRGPQGEGFTLYASHTVWADRASFEGWTRSEAFRAAHKGVKPNDGLYLGPPVLEIFETVEGVAASQGD